MAVSLKDVAHAAGVSIKTVSNVVNDYPFVSAGTRARVQSAIDELGYRPNLSARRLRNGRSGLIALSIPEIAAPYFAELADQVVAAAEARGLTVLIDKTGGQRGHEQQTAAGIRSNLVDGTIASPLAMTAHDVELLGRTHPLVLLGERLSQVAVDHVAIDSVEAARVATQHLLDLGRRRIAVIGTGEDITNTGRLRLRGYQDALAGAGLAPDPGLSGDARWYHRPDGQVAMQELLARRPDLDAVFCFNDLLAIGALRALREAGRRVPEDVAVVGFDDVEDCLYTAPPLTSIAPDKDAIATTAVDLLVRRMDGTAPAEPQEVFPPFALAVRESSAGADA
jgi:LacI family transcriptional regulator, repressor for deo operon, udp, cdd, tsx, nupC, and nupG